MTHWKFAKAIDENEEFKINQMNISSEDKENCPMLLNDVEELTEKYKQIKKELK